MTTPIYAMTDTWTAGATTYTAIGMNVTNTASAAASKLIDLQVGSSSKFSVRKDGTLLQPVLVSNESIATAGANQGTATATTADQVQVATSAADEGLKLRAAIVGARQKIINITANRIKIYPVSGEVIGRNAANAFQYLLGYGVAEFECVVAGTWWPVAGLGAGRGTGYGQGLVTSLTDGNGAATFVYSPSGSSYIWINDNFEGFFGATTYINGITVIGGSFLSFKDGGNNYTVRVTPSGGATGHTLKFQMVEDNGLGISDTLKLTAVSASGVNALEIVGSTTGNPVQINTYGTDSDINLKFTPKGSGVVQFGTHSAIAAETVTGYITVKDAGGTTRKLAVVS